MTPRKKLPNRRRTVTQTLEYSNSTWSVSVGFDDRGNAREVFVDGTKGELEGIIDDACVDLSKRLQAGQSALEIAQDHGGTESDPASVIGRVAWLIVDLEREFGLRGAAE